MRKLDQHGSRLRLKRSQLNKHLRRKRSLPRRMMTMTSTFSVKSLKPIKKQQNKLKKKLPNRKRVNQLLLLNL